MGRNQERVETIVHTCETVLYFRTYSIFFKEIVCFFILFFFLWLFLFSSIFLTKNAFLVRFWGSKIEKYFHGLQINYWTDFSYRKNGCISENCVLVKTKTTTKSTWKWYLLTINDFRISSNSSNWYNYHVTFTYTGSAVFQFYFRIILKVLWNETSQLTQRMILK